MTPWFCEAHRVTTTGDCPKCDDELERLAALSICHVCQRTLLEGETAWASDWTVIDTSGSRADMRRETRYACDACADEQEKDNA